MNKNLKNLVNVDMKNRRVAEPTPKGRVLLNFLGVVGFAACMVCLLIVGGR